MIGVGEQEIGFKQVEMSRRQLNKRVIGETCKLETRIQEYSAHELYLKPINENQEEHATLVAKCTVYEEGEMDQIYHMALVIKYHENQKVTVGFSNTDISGDFG